MSGGVGHMALGWIALEGLAWYGDECNVSERSVLDGWMDGEAEEYMA